MRTDHHLKKFSNIIYDSSEHQLSLLHIKPAKFCQPCKKLNIQEEKSDKKVLKLKINY